MFAFHETLSRADLAFTDRHDGHSTGPWASLNLGASNGDDEATVARNLRDAVEAFGGDPDRTHLVRQVHGRGVRVVTADDDPTAPRAAADALVTAVPGAVLVVRVADCLPVVLVDDENAVAAVVHAGRKGVVLDVAGAAVEAMRALGAERITAWLGPRACGHCYEVPEAMRDEVARQVTGTWAQTRSGTPALDLAAGVAGQLRAADVDVVDLADHHPMCTIEGEKDFFSYRRQGERSGRLAALVRVRG
ncbi:peptidoglycan editing factor PgeF [Mumia sp. zg.B53]|uniref:peptidoglycan editing factor PgeF n=1 Tax=unclassified Mumia TaxID=2621872 RepID=UPI001C6E5EA1|nr:MULTISPECIES: peptidoglycan editing factor PgeF [unclassified Mumia]MBW9211477.1 peptidoglycan editing factor PgeF [Mumia sp. zg.B21]MBW9216650.1 peptidoglycan editing factor PgeF [Mumia sp. zg.B53]